MALGATGGKVAGLVLREVGVLAGCGAVAGALGAIAAMRAMQSLLFGLGGFDPWVLGGMVFLLGFVALAAGAMPAWRAARVEPLTALRHE